MLMITHSSSSEEFEHENIALMTAKPIIIPPTPEITDTLPPPIIVPTPQVTIVKSIPPPYRAKLRSYVQILF